MTMSRRSFNRLDEHDAKAMDIAQDERVTSSLLQDNEGVDSQFNGSTSSHGIGNAECPIMLPSNSEEKFTDWYLTKYSSVLIGTQLAWAIQISYASAIFLKMGIRRQMLGLLRIPGPVTGLICQPVFGVMIDMDNKKRRFSASGSPASSATGSPYEHLTWSKKHISAIPLSVTFVVIACALCFFGLIMMAIGDVIGAGGHAVAGCVIASVGLWMVDIGFNGADVAMRAVTAINVPRSKQPAANGALAGAMGTGQILGFMIGAIPMKAFVQKISGSNNFGDFEGNVIAACLLILLSFCCSWYTLLELKERDTGNLTMQNDLTSENDDETRRDEERVQFLTTDNLVESPSDHRTDNFVQMLASSYNICSRDMPTSFYHIAITTSLSWLGWFPYIYYATDFVGQNVFNGSPGRSGSASERYDAGVRFANLWLAINSVVVMIASRTFVPIVGRIHIGYTYVSGIAMLSVLLLLFSTIGSNELVMTSIVIMLLGVPWSVSASVPYALISMENNSVIGNKVVSGLLGKLNIFVVVPGMIVLAVVYIFTPVGLTSQWLIFGGSLFSILGTIYGFTKLKKMK